MSILILVSISTVCRSKLTCGQTQFPLSCARETGRVRGFAFVEMAEDTAEDAAIAALDSAEWMGRQLRLNKAKPKGSE